MRIAIDATAACRPDRTGIPHYIMRLVDAMRGELTPEDRLSIGCRLSRWKVRHHRFLPDGLPNFWMQEPLWPPAPPHDVIHGTDAWVPMWRRSVRVATVHDLAVLLFPGISSQRFMERKRAEYMRLTRRCHRIIAVSQRTKDDFAQMFGYPAERIDVVHHGVSEDFHPRPAEELAGLRAQYDLPAQFMLFVGRVSFRKNTENLLRALALSGATRDVPLVWVGTQSFGHGELMPLIDQLGLEGQVRFLGYVPQPHMPLLFSAAQALLYPTNYEGFGIPVLEAMRSGIPVLAGNRGSVPEIAAGHATLVDPEDSEAIGQGIRDVLARDAAGLEAARQHALGFTWQACAANTLAVYQKASQMR